MAVLQTEALCTIAFCMIYEWKYCPFLPPHATPQQAKWGKGWKIPSPGVLLCFRSFGCLLTGEKHNIKQIETLWFNLRQSSFYILAEFFLTFDDNPEGRLMMWEVRKIFGGFLGRNIATSLTQLAKTGN